MASETVRGTGDYDEFLLATMYLGMYMLQRVTGVLQVQVLCGTYRKR